MISDTRPSLFRGRKKPTNWVGHPIDIRLSVPFMRARYYLTIVAGRERRPSHRRKTERQDYPVLTFGNALFALGITTMFAVLGLALLIVRSAIIEY